MGSVLYGAHSDGLSRVALPRPAFSDGKSVLGTGHVGVFTPQTSAPARVLALHQSWLLLIY